MVRNNLARDVTGPFNPNYGRNVVTRFNPTLIVMLSFVSFIYLFVMIIIITRINVIITIIYFNIILITIFIFNYYLNVLHSF